MKIRNGLEIKKDNCLMIVDFYDTEHKDTIVDFYYTVKKPFGGVEEFQANCEYISHEELKKFLKNHKYTIFYNKYNKKYQIEIKD